MTVTGTLSSLADKWGLEVDLTPLARREQAYSDMLAAALARDDTAWNEAKARFHAPVDSLWGKGR